MAPVSQIPPHDLLDDIQSFVKEDVILSKLLSSFGKDTDDKWRLDKDVLTAEDDALATLEAHRDDIMLMRSKLHGCISLLDEVGDDLNKFVPKMNSFLEQVWTLQKQSEDVNSEIQFQKDLQVMLSAYIDRILVTPKLENCIKTELPNSAQFFEALAEIEKRSCHAEEPGFDQYPSSKDSRRALYELRLVAIERCREFITQKMHASFREPKTNVTIVQQVFKTQTHPLYKFLSIANHVAAMQLRNHYVGMISKVHFKQASVYMQDLRQVPIKLASWKAVEAQMIDFGCPPNCIKPPQNASANNEELSSWFTTVIAKQVSPPSFPQSSEADLIVKLKDTDAVFRTRLAILVEWDKAVLPALEGTKEAEFPEEVYRSGLKALVGTALAEWEFIKGYFYSPDSVNGDQRRPSIEIQLDGTVTNAPDPASQINRCFEQVFLKTELACKESLEKDLTENCDLLSVALMWRLTDAFLQQVLQAKVTSMANLLNALQVRFTAHLGHLVVFMSHTLTTYVNQVSMNLEAKHLPNPYGGASDGVLSHQFVSFLTAIYYQLTAVALHAPLAVSQANNIALKLRDLAAAIRKAIDVLEAHTEKTGKDILVVLGCLETLSRGLESVQTDDSLTSSNPIARLTMEMVEWTAEYLQQMSETVSERYLQKVCPVLLAMVRDTEAYIECGNYGRCTSSEAICQLQDQLMRQEAQSAKDLSDIFLELNENWSNRISRPLAEDLLRRTFTKYLLFHTRLQKVAESVMEQVPDSSLVQYLEAFPPAHTLMAQTKLYSLK